MRRIVYNSQRNNYDFAGAFSAWSQCFSTCAWMLISYYDNDYDALDDNSLAQYVDEVEASVGHPGVAEKIVQKYKWITGKTSLWFAVQQAGIQQYLPQKKVIMDDQCNIETLLEIIQYSPVIIGTNRMGGLPNGHIVLLVDFKSLIQTFIVNDPFGDARSNYRNYNGDSVQYPFDYLKKYINYGNNKCRVIYVA